ncbi:hypothetical protein FisN_5Lh336 [Fistulifera solaris]|uniref:Uncharacterized protein n=1 Tax=Fistulifera solaris TaxID=1519565 RepID=A0A1Z5KG14_FISSO|nr:hypothetical protein FisN_5Lh336 [Fistulifera solaris]|eukprot:GAX25254.1 hypothetical protein FisN_5Lh336 [Fistulifera solaris]
MKDEPVLSVVSAETHNASLSQEEERSDLIHNSDNLESAFDDEYALPTPHNPHGLPGKIGVLPLAVIVFYNVSGGPFGVEASVRSAGNFYTLLGFLIMPFLWSLQEAAITAELGAAFPESSGGVAWVEEAFGSMAGWISGYLNWIAGATDNAIYPVLFLDYVVEVLQPVDSDAPEAGGVRHPVIRFCLLSSISISLAYVNYLGLDVVGKMAIAICFVAMSPFMILTIVGAFKVDPSRWFQMPTETVVADDVGTSFWDSITWGGVLWRPFINNLFWNLNSFDAAACLSADVEDPGKIFPQGMMWGFVLVAAGYFVPLLVALGASDAPQSAWVDGYLGRVASEVVGQWLGDWTIFAAGISNVALFLAELSSDAFQILGMAERGFLPSIFATRSRYGTPTYGILLGTAVIVVMGVTDLDHLIEMLNFNYSISLLFEFAAFIKLRITRPDIHRPWKIPFGTTGCIIFLAPTLVMTVAVLLLASWTTYLFSMATVGLGAILYMTATGKKGCCSSGRHGMTRVDSSISDNLEMHSPIPQSIPSTGDDILNHRSSNVLL